MCELLYSLPTTPTRYKGKLTLAIRCGKEVTSWATMLAYSLKFKNAPHLPVRPPALPPCHSSTHPSTHRISNSPHLHSPHLTSAHLTSTPLTSPPLTSLPFTAPPLTAPPLTAPPLTALPFTAPPLTSPPLTTHTGAAPVRRGAAGFLAQGIRGRNKVRWGGGEWSVGEELPWRGGKGRFQGKL